MTLISIIAIIYGAYLLIGGLWIWRLYKKNDLISDYPYDGEM
jgi:hypothetical protein